MLITSVKAARALSVPNIILPGKSLEITGFQEELIHSKL